MEVLNKQTNYSPFTEQITDCDKRNWIITQLILPSTVFTGSNVSSKAFVLKEQKASSCSTLQAHYTITEAKSRSPIVLTSVNVVLIIRNPSI